MVSSIADVEAAIKFRVGTEHELMVAIGWTYVRGEVIITVRNCPDECAEAVKQTIIETVREVFPMKIRHIATAAI